MGEFLGAPVSNPAWIAKPLSRAGSEIGASICRVEHLILLGRRTGKVIVPLTVKDILEEQLARKLT